MDESRDVLLARIRAVEFQRGEALTAWAIDRATLELAQGALAQRDAQIAALTAELEALKAKPEPGTPEGT